jgi:thiosulfate dehydrogenase [quinone] large subunit
VAVECISVLFDQPPVRAARKVVFQMTGLSIWRKVGVALARVTVGWVFLYAGLEKFFGAQPFTAAGFLKFGTIGTTVEKVADGTIVNPTHGFWVSLAGNGTLLPIVNSMVVFGEIAIGVALILGLATRFAAVMGALMMTLFWVAAWDFAFGVIEYHAVLAIVALVLGIIGAGEAFGLDAIVDETPIVKRIPALKFVLS